MKTIPNASIESCENYWWNWILGFFNYFDAGSNVTWNIGDIKNVKNELAEGIIFKTKRKLPTVYKDEHEVQVKVEQGEKFYNKIQLKSCVIENVS